ncbi:hypothetical protein EES43_22635 [Streptomyces sp. ADI96-02]|uniref:hypothetical protein n=1 Tax=Streptomyces sp. ADI96-02 TaxID=1522760 RepID=UPI000F54F443|nr:hypothetical protein [Streptomyces sp. ADI96-02]RPK57194.1 hypothetical protein EES43_22635 [Streptomyces sp. ADI96-02]
MVKKPESDTEPKEGRLDLSLPQVAGSAVAAVAAAVLASQLGVYGTIAGAGVMSVVATCGGSVFQHFFRRTGEQIREVTVQVTHPEGRQVTVRTRETRPARDPEEPRPPADDATTVLRTVGPGADPDRTRPIAPGPDADRTQSLDLNDARTRMLRVPPGGPTAGADRTQLLPQAGRGAGPGAGPGPRSGSRDDAFTEGVTHGTRLRGWKRPALAAATVFGVSMAGITVFEMVSGNELGGGTGTTLSSVVRGGDRDPGHTDPAPSQDSERDDDPGDRRPGPGGTESPPATYPDGDSGPSTDPGTGESGSTGPSPSPEPSDPGGGETSETPSPDPSDPGGGTSVPPDPTGTGAPGGEQRDDQAPPGGEDR